MEFGVQSDAGARNRPVFGAPGSGIFTLDVTALNPTVFTPTFYSRPSRRRFTDLDSFSVFVQDQFEIGKGQAP